MKSTWYLGIYLISLWSHLLFYTRFSEGGGGGGDKKTLNALIFTPNAEFCKIKQHAQDVVA